MADGACQSACGLLSGRRYGQEREHHRRISKAGQGERLDSSRPHCKYQVTSFSHTGYNSSCRVKIWDAINDGTIYSCPSLLASFAMICFADLKKYRFTYLFAFPALHSEPSWKVLPRKYPAAATEGGSDSENAKAPLSSSETTALVDAVQTWRYSVDVRQYGFFLAKKKRRGNTEGYGNNEDSDIWSQIQSTTPGSPAAGLNFTWVIGSLSTYEHGFFRDTPANDQFVCFADPSNYDSYPGWMLRNLLVLVRRKWGLDKVQILCYRDIQAQRHEARSLLLQLEIGEPDTNTLITDEMPKITGWERGATGKVASKIANLGEYMDPQR